MSTQTLNFLVNGHLKIKKLNLFGGKYRTLTVYETSEFNYVNTGIDNYANRLEVKSRTINNYNVFINDNKTLTDVELYCYNVSLQGLYNLKKLFIDSEKTIIGNEEKINYNEFRWTNLISILKCYHLELTKQIVEQTQEYLSKTYQDKQKLIETKEQLLKIQQQEFRQLKKDIKVEINKKEQSIKKNLSKKSIKYYNN